MNRAVESAKLNKAVLKKLEGFLFADANFDAIQDAMSPPRGIIAMRKPSVRVSVRVGIEIEMEVGTIRERIDVEGEANAVATCELRRASEPAKRRYLRDRKSVV